MPTEPESTGDAVPLECELTIAAPPSKVFPYFTDPERMVAWMGAEAVLNPSPGGLFKVRLDMGFVARGSYVEVDPPRRVVFSWGWENEDTLVPPGASEVVVELEPVAEGTRVSLTHNGLSEAAARQHEIGWRHYLGRLEIAGAGGDAGPDRGPQPDAERGLRP